MKKNTIPEKVKGKCEYEGCESEEAYWTGFGKYLCRKHFEKELTGLIKKIFGGALVIILIISLFF